MKTKWKLPLSYKVKTLELDEVVTLELDEAVKLSIIQDKFCNCDSDSWHDNQVRPQV